MFHHYHIPRPTEKPNKSTVCLFLHNFLRTVSSKQIKKNTQILFTLFNVNGKKLIKTLESRKSLTFFFNGKSPKWFVDAGGVTKVKSVYRSGVLAINCFASLFLRQHKKRLCWCRTKSGLTDKNHSVVVIFFFCGSWKAWLGWLLAASREQCSLNGHCLLLYYLALEARCVTSISHSSGSYEWIFPFLPKRNIVCEVT